MKNKKEVDENWPALLKGTILTANISKLINFISIFDKRAETMITINSLLIPFILLQYKNELFLESVIMSSFVGFISIYLAIFSLFPKKYSKHKSERNLFHFVHISKFDEKEYLEKLKKILDTNKLGEEVGKDIFHTSKYILTPKLNLIKYSYFIFAFGNLISILILFKNIFF